MESGLGHFDFHETIEARGGEYTAARPLRRSFRPVVEAFIENFREEEELGAACSVVIDGETVVDLWGGWARADRSQDWDEHTTVCMMSVAKGVTGICFNMADRPRADRSRTSGSPPTGPSSRRTAKQDITVRMVLDHTAAIPVLTDDVMYPGGFFDFPAYIRRSRCSTRCGSRAPARPTTCTTRASCSARSCAG